jgi:16S rRNA (guanine966-N2)-methyltransferase
LRIIGGQWRGSRLPVLDKKGLRPTPDRVRETVFNWLNPYLRGARVLDCFAGAGGLGFEAASRYAQKVVMVDLDREVSTNLEKQANRLNAENISIEKQGIEAYLVTEKEAFDIVFIDPPYDHPELRDSVVSHLFEGDLVTDQSLLFIEWPVDQEALLNEFGLTWIKHKVAGQVNYAIAQRE